MEAPTSGKHGPERDPAVGLCSVCSHARHQDGRRGSSYWRCERADEEPGFLKYPPLPVLECGGFESR